MFCKNLRSDDLRVQNFEAHCVIRASLLNSQTPPRATRTRVCLWPLYKYVVLLRSPLAEKS